MNMKPFDPARILRMRDIPGVLWLAIRGAVRGRLRFAWRLCRTCLRVTLLALGLSACAPHPTALVYCLTPPQLQKLKDAEPPLIGDKLTGDAQDDFKLVAGSDVMLRQYGHDLLHVLENCTEPSGSTR